jgi:hypothetical protein
VSYGNEEVICLSKRKNEGWATCFAAVCSSHSRCSWRSGACLSIACSTSDITVVLPLGEMHLLLAGVRRAFHPRNLRGCGGLPPSRALFQVVALTHPAFTVIIRGLNARSFLQRVAQGAPRLGSWRRPGRVIRRPLMLASSSSSPAGSSSICGGLSEIADKSVSVHTPRFSPSHDPLPRRQSHSCSLSVSFHPLLWGLDPLIRPLSILPRP